MLLANDAPKVLAYARIGKKKAPWIDEDPQIICHPLTKAAYPCMA
jgi:hypothetical protein